MTLQRKPGLLLLTAGFISAACDHVLGLEPLDPPSSEASVSGAGGRAESGGDASNGGSDGNDGAGAAGMEAAGGGRGGNSGGLEGGAAGASGSPANPGGYDAGGHAYGGAAGEVQWATPGAPCATAGDLACRAPASALRFVCSDGVWVATTPCRTSDGFDERCDRRTGTCGTVQCEAAGPAWCSDDSSFVCGPDLVTTELVNCDFGCSGSTHACDLPLSRELLIDRPATFGVTAIWPSPLIAVCWREPAPASQELRDVVREAVDTAWGRRSGASFVGWGECSGETEGVELELLDDCDGTLASVPRVGYPGPGNALRIGLCQSYFREGVRQPEPGKPTDLSLLHFVAQHAFGHVLGLPDVGFDRSSSGIMERALDLEQYRAITLGSDNIGFIQRNYGAKASGSLIDARGRCLAAGSDQLSGEACAGSPAQAWRPEPSRFVHGQSGHCLRTTSAGSNTVKLGACTGEAEREGFRPEQVRLLTSGGNCVSATPPPVGESPLGVATCSTGWPKEEVFALEFLADARVRVRAHDGTCLKWPASWQVPSLPSLGPCDGVREEFEARDGMLSTSGHCLTPVYRTRSGLEFRACLASSSFRFVMSGQLVLGTKSLTIAGTRASPSLTLSSTRTTPTVTQIFDYFF